jgi:hypothetical protein
LLAAPCADPGVPTRDRLRNSRGLKRTETGQRFLEGFEAIRHLRRGRGAWRRSPGARPRRPSAGAAGGRCYPCARARSAPTRLSDHRTDYWIPLILAPSLHRSSPFSTHQVSELLKTAGHRVTARSCMRCCVLTRRGVATADVTAPRAAPQVEPPTAVGEAFDATAAARRNFGSIRVSCMTFKATREVRRCRPIFALASPWSGFHRECRRDRRFEIAQECLQLTQPVRNGDKPAAT